MPQSENDVVTKIREDVGEDVEIHDSSGPEAVFLTTRSKIELALRKYRSGVLSETKWVNPTLTMITIPPILLVTDFQRSFGLSKEVWKAFFIIILLVSIIWLLKSIYEYLNNRSKANIEYVIRDLESNR